MMPSITRSAETSCAERGNGRTSTGTASAGSCTQDLRDRRLLLADRRGNPVSVRLHDLVEPRRDVVRLTAFHRDAFVLMTRPYFVRARIRRREPSHDTVRHARASGRPSSSRSRAAGSVSIASFDTAQLQGPTPGVM